MKIEAAVGTSAECLLCASYTFYSVFSSFINWTTIFSVTVRQVLPHWKDEEAKAQRRGKYLPHTTNQMECVLQWEPEPRCDFPGNFATSPIPQLVREQGDSWEIVLVVTPLVVGTRCLTGTRKEEFGVFVYQVNIRVSLF